MESTNSATVGRLGMTPNAYITPVISKYGTCRPARIVGGNGYGVSHNGIANRREPREASFWCTWYGIWLRKRVVMSIGYG